jgi:hypothetical protein
MSLTIPQDLLSVEGVNQDWIAKNSTYLFDDNCTNTSYDVEGMYDLRVDPGRSV